MVKKQLKRFLIMPNYLKKETVLYATELVRYLKSKDIFAYILSESRCDGEGNQINPRDFDIAVVLGGDGSVLFSAIYRTGSDLPVVGINFGNVGYMTECDPDESYSVIDSILDGDYYVEQRLMIRGVIRRDGRTIKDFRALNDAVIHRAAMNHALRLGIYINDKPITDITADGIILSTPTGSTAYNLSAGGPVLTPTSHNFVMTPICPQFCTCSSIVTSGDDVITVKIEMGQNNYRGALLVADGNQNFEIQGGDLLEISASSKKFPIIKVKDNSFYRTLQNKLSRNH